MAMSLLERMAAQARAPTYVLALGDRRGFARRLELEERLEVVRSPRHAAILLVGSPLPEPLHSAARLVHDQMPHPRTVLVCPGNAEVFPSATTTSVEGAASDICEAYAALQSGLRGSSKPLLPRENPVEWKGVGPHGQGGKGMMKGKPYGRSMAMTGEDVRDGLQLDNIQATFGPFLPWMPPGLELAVALQGDLLQEATPRVPEALPTDMPDIFVRAVDEPVSIAELELDRARHHLEATADMLLLHGLESRARKALGLAHELRAGDAAPVRRFARSLRWTFALRFSARDVGWLDASKVAGLGPVSRASGNEEDARSDDPAYQKLDFQPITHDRGDALARFRQRLAEAAQSVELAGRAADEVRAPGPTVEGPRGPMDREKGARWKKLLVEHAPGMPWDEFVTTLVSLDIDASQLPVSDDYASARVGCFSEDPGEDEDQDDDGHGHHHHGGH